MPEQIPEMAVRIRQAHVTALLHVDCDCDCDDCNLEAVAVLAMPEMRAIKAALLSLASLNTAGAARIDVLRLAGLPEVVIDWVLS